MKTKRLLEKPFLFIKLPKEKEVYFYPDLSDKHDKPDENDIEFVGFDLTLNLRLKTSKFEQLDLTDLSDFKFAAPLNELQYTNQKTFASFEKLTKKTINFLKHKTNEKVVISREKWNPKVIQNPIESYIKLCKKNPNGYCFLLYLNDRDLWMSATPETLGSVEGRIFSSMSLAGTLGLDSGENWSEKELNEQRIVTQYMSERLKNRLDNFKQSKTYTYKIGELQHLRTDFSGQIRENDSADSIIHDLHPSPSVCGFPKEISKKFILDNENYNREYYSGYLKVKLGSIIYYLVNIRSAKIYSNGILQYAGAGITSDSNVEKEWKETELKCKVIFDSIL